jgi:hypothetical protein
MPPGHYFATSNTSQLEMRARTLQALQFDGYSGHGEVTILSDGAEIMKRLPKALPKPTTHITAFLLPTGSPDTGLGGARLFGFDFRQGFGSQLPELS